MLKRVHLNIPNMASLERLELEVRDALDAGDAKKALKLCQSSSEETASLLVLKSLALLRLGRRPDAYRAATDAQMRLDSEAGPVEVLVGVFRELRAYTHIAELYEKAFQTSPTQQLAQQLFEAYAADFRFVEQQSLCMKLFKRYEALDYAVRAAECLYLTAKVDLRQSRMAEIAQLLLNKVTRTQEFQCSEAFLRVYVLVLIEVRQFAEAIALLEQYAPCMPNFVERTTFLANLHRKTGQKIQALNYFHDILRLNLVEATARPLWSSYCAYIDTVFDLVADAIQPAPTSEAVPLDPAAYFVKNLDSSSKGNAYKPFTGTESLTSVLTLALGNIKGAKEAVEGAGKVAKEARREAYLAELEFKRKLVYSGFAQGPEDYKSENEPGNVFFHPIFRYATTQYEHESACEDLIPYLKLLNVSQLAPLRTKLTDYFVQISELSTNKVRILKCYVTGMKVLRLLGCFSPPFIKHHGLLWDSVKQIQAKYVDALSVEQVPSQGEVRIADELMMLACEILLQPMISPVLDPVEVRKCEFSQYQFEEEGGALLTHRILHCIGMLESALRRSPFNSKLKLALADLYNRAGALETAHRLYISLDFVPSDFTKTAHLIYGPMHDFYPFLNELEPIAKRVLKFTEGHRESVLPLISDAYARHSLTELLELRNLCARQDRSIFAFVSKLTILELDIFRKLNQAPAELSRLFRESAELINQLCSLRSSSEELVSVVDDSYTFYVGVVPVQSMVYKSTKAKYDPHDFNLPARMFVRKERIVANYGWKCELRALSLKGTVLKLYFDSMEGNSEVLDTDLRDYVSLLDEMGLLQGQGDKQHQVDRQEEVLSTKEAARKAKEELQADEAFYSGAFATEEAFKAHRKAVSALLQKFQLMLAEGHWRLLKGHASRKAEEGKESGPGELDPTLRLTEWQHISRHFEVLEMMFRETISSLIPREDLFNFLKLKSGEVFNGPVSVPLHPGMAGVIAECLSGPYTTLMLLQPRYFQAIASASSRLMDNPDPAEVESMKQQVRRFYNEVYRHLEFLLKFLELQSKTTVVEESISEIQQLSAFQAYSLAGGLESAVYTKIAENFKQAHEWTLRTLAEDLRFLWRLPRL